LQYFNPKHKTQLIADASPVVLGAVLLQFHGDDEPMNIVKYKTGKENIADTFSRLCKLNPGYFYDMKGEHSILHVIENATSSSMMSTEIAGKRRCNVVPANKSWNASSSNNLSPFRHELSLI